MLTKTQAKQHGYIFQAYNGGRLEMFKKWFDGDNERGSYIRIAFEVGQIEPNEILLVFPSAFYPLKRETTMEDLETLIRVLGK